jgi:hypothetical protein
VQYTLHVHLRFGSVDFVVKCDNKLQLLPGDHVMDERPWHPSRDVEAKLAGRETFNLNLEAQKLDARDVNALWELCRKVVFSLIRSSAGSVRNRNVQVLVGI